MRGPILLVEDDENDLFFMTDAFRKAGLENFRVARTGQEAIGYLKRCGNPAECANWPVPELILLDMKLPYVMGLDVLQFIRQELHLSTVVLILSASREPADVAAAYGRGANAYLAKPSDLTKLQTLVEAIKAFWLSHNIFPSAT